MRPHQSYPSVFMLTINLPHKNAWPLQLLNIFTTAYDTLLQDLTYMLTTHFCDPFYDTFLWSILRHIFTPGWIPIHFTTQFPNPFYDTPVQDKSHVSEHDIRHLAAFMAWIMSTLTYKLLHVICPHWPISFLQVRLIPARASSVCHSEWARRLCVSRSMAVSCC